MLKSRFCTRSHSDTATMKNMRIATVNIVWNPSKAIPIVGWMPRGVFFSQPPTLEAMSEPEAAENGCGEREAIPLIRLVRNDDPIVGCR